MSTGHTYATPAPEKEHPNTTMGDPDGPMVFIATLGQEVPTFIDPREDLVIDKKTLATFKRLSYHIPFKLRGTYKPEWLPDGVAEHMIESGVRTNFQGFVMCSEKSARNGGGQCGNLAMNRSGFCRNHGGALHPADKKVHADNLMNAPADRVENLTRVQKFLQGFLKVEDLADEEILGAYILSDDGRPVSNKKLGVKFQQQMVKELHARMNQYMQMKLPTMLKRVAEIAESDIVEPEVSFKAAVWMAERQMGKTPEVLIHAQTGAPYESILDSIESGSRDDYRKSVESQRGAGQPLAIEGSHTPGVYSEDGEPLDVFEVDDGEADPTYEGFLVRTERTGGDELGGEERGVSRLGSEDNSLSRADSLEQKAKRAKDVIEARKKAQKRRFAARATGATSLNDMWWLPSFKKRMVMRKGTMIHEGWTCKLVCPDDQSQALLAKMAAASTDGE